MKLLVGIDPGTKTGLAVWDKADQIFRSISTVSMTQAQESLVGLKNQGDLDQVWFEDARLRRWYGGAGRERLQGVGSIKRDCSLWQEFCEHHGIKFKPLKPQRGGTKWSAEDFKRITGWTKRTSEHGRDAACLVFGVQ